MQLVALNSTPRDAQTSKTDQLLQAFLAGAQEAGATCELIYLRNFKIMPCLGCFGCWLKTPGHRVQSDDMTDKLFSKFVQADIVVLASPLYYFSMNACLKSFCGPHLAHVRTPVYRYGRADRPPPAFRPDAQNCYPERLRFPGPG